MELNDEFKATYVFSIAFTTRIVEMLGCFFFFLNKIIVSVFTCLISV